MKPGTLEEDLHKSYKKYLKNVIEENFKNVTFQNRLEEMSQITCVVTKPGVML